MNTLLTEYQLFLLMLELMLAPGLFTLREKSPRSKPEASIWKQVFWEVTPENTNREAEKLGRKGNKVNSVFMESITMVTNYSWFQYRSYLLPGNNEIETKHLETLTETCHWHDTQMNFYCVLSKQWLDTEYQCFTTDRLQEVLEQNSQP